MYKNIIEDIRNIKDLETVINYYYPNQLRKNKMKCPFHNDKTPSLQIADKGSGAFYKCFGCQAGGDVIDFIRRVENIEFIEALKRAYQILNKPLELPKKNTIRVNTTNKKKINVFYENKIKEAIKNNNLDEAFEFSCKKEKEEERKYFINFPYLDSKGKPQKDMLLSKQLTLEEYKNRGNLVKFKEGFSRLFSSLL